MRVVQLEVEGHRIEFHPYVTVLRELPAGVAAPLLSALESLASGDAAAPGVVEAHGVFLDLSDETLTLLDLGGPGGSGVDVVARAEQLPAALRPGTLARNELDRRRETIADELAQLEAELERARRALAVTREAGDQPPSSVERLTGELERQIQQRHMIETHLEEATRAHVEAQQALHAQQARLARARQKRTNASRAVEDAGRALEAAQAERDALATAASDASAVDWSLAMDELERRRAEIEASLHALETVDPYPVECALEQLTSRNDVEPVTSAEAQRVADEWVRNEAALVDDDVIDTTEGHVLAAAGRRLDAARAALFEAELKARIRDIDRLDVEALDTAHDTRGEQRLEECRAELSAAEDAFAVFEKRIEAELARAELIARRRELRDEARSILGRDAGDDIEWALRHHRVEIAGDDRDEDRIDGLRAALISAGIVLGPGPLPQHVLVEFAEIWLAEQREASLRRDELAHALDEVQAALRTSAPFAQADAESSGDAEPRAGDLDDARAVRADVEDLLRRQSESDAEMSRRTSGRAEALEVEWAAVTELVDAERSEVEAARSEHDAAEERARLEAELTTARAAESETAEAVEGIEGVVSARGDAQVVTTAAAVENLEWYLLSRIAKQRALSYAGSLPFVVGDALEGVRGGGLEHLLDRLECVSSAVQIVIISDDSEMAAWADAIGADRAVALCATPL